MSIGIEDLGLGHESQVSTVLVHYRQIPCAGVFKNLHHFVHRQIKPQNRGRRSHELAHRKPLVQPWLEHDIPHFVQQQNTLQMPLMVNHREDIPLALADHFD